VVLFTAEEFKDWEGIPGTRYDALIARIAIAVSAAVDRYCRRTIEGADYTEEIDGSGSTEISITHPPLRAVSSVAVTELRDFADATPLTSDQFVFESHGVIRLMGQVFPRGRRNIQISYSGGFLTVPEDLKQAALMWAGALFVRRRQGGLSSSTSGPLTLTFQAHQQVPLEVQAMLNPYRLVPRFGGRNVVAV